MRFVSVWSWVRSPQGAHFVAGCQLLLRAWAAANHQKKDSQARDRQLGHHPCRGASRIGLAWHRAHPAHKCSGSGWKAFCNRPRGPMDKASAYGAGDCRFESCRGHFHHDEANLIPSITRSPPGQLLHACYIRRCNSLLFDGKAQVQLL